MSPVEQLKTECAGLKKTIKDLEYKLEQKDSIIELAYMGNNTLEVMESYRTQRIIQLEAQLLAALSFSSDVSGELVVARQKIFDEAVAAKADSSQEEVLHLKAHIKQGYQAYCRLEKNRLDLKYEIVCLQAKIKSLELCLLQASDWFGEYAEQHETKESTEKAQRNRERQNICRNTVDGVCAGGGA
jgi:hypothetical protein